MYSRLGLIVIHGKVRARPLAHGQQTKTKNSKDMNLKFTN